MKTFNIVGLVIYFTFYSSLYIKLFIQRSKGLKTIQLGKGNKPKRTMIVEVFLTIMLFIISITQFVVLVFDKSFPLILNNSLIRSLGIVVAISGIIVLNIAMATLKDSWKSGVDYDQKTKLVTYGIYKYSRNPGFVGFILFYLGMMLFFSNILNIIVTLIVIISFHLQILEEERFLKRSIGKEYLDYLIQTRRYIGRKKG